MGLRVASLTCDDCGRRRVSRWDSSEDSAAGLVSEARREHGWQAIGTAWLCEECTAKFRRIEREMIARREALS